MDNISQNLVKQSQAIKTLFVAAFLIISLFFIGGLSFSFSSYGDVLQLKKRVTRISELRSQITLLDEILTMSALMAATTGDLKWEIRYYDNEPKLRMALNELVSLTHSINFGQAAIQTQETNDRLVEMENKAFQHIRDGLMYEAQAILFGTEYQEHKTAYAQGMSDQENKFKEYVSTILTEEKKQRQFVFIILLVIFLIILVIGILVYKIVKRWQVELVLKNEEIKSANFKVVQSEKLASIGQLAAGIAHEINNPIGFVSNNVSILEDYIKAYYKILVLIEDLNIALKNKEEAHLNRLYKELIKIEEEANLKFIKEDLGSLMGETKVGLERVSEIVKDLKLFARNDHDKLKFIKIEDIIESILSIVQVDMKYKARIIKEYGETGQVKCVPQKIGQVFINLLMNAGQAIEKSGTITIRTFQKEGWVYAQIADSGNGMDEEKMAKIFEPFYTTKPAGKGTGLGLSISYEIVQRYGGDLRVESKKGQGAVFTVSLPQG